MKGYVLGAHTSLWFNKYPEKVRRGHKVQIRHCQQQLALIGERIAVEASVMMYEWCEDLNELTGKKYQDIAQRLLSQAALAKTRIARKKLADFFKQEKPVLSEIRHNAGAHREHDFMKQMEVLEGVGWSGTIDRLHRFEEVTLELGKTMKPLMEAGLKKIGEAI